MNFSRKTYKLLLILCLLVLGARTSQAAEIQDVPGGFWAENQIVDCVNRGYFRLDSNYKFYPNGSIQRGEFVNVLLKVMESSDVIKGAKAYFTDVNASVPYVKDIAVSQNLGIVYGYPDKTFKPANAITHSEATSVIANISKTKIDNKSLLDEFQDAGEIPSWAVDSYTKVVDQNLYVNHPDPSRFTPNAKMTRAEAAVLFAKMAGDMDLLKLKYPRVSNIPEILLSEETLHLYHKASRDAVKIYNTKKVIEAGNVIIAHPLESIDSRTIENGSILQFEAPADVYSEEGTLLYNAGARFTAKVHQVQNRTWINKQNKVLFIFNHAQYVDGMEKEMAAVAYTTDRGRVVKVTDANSKKKYKESTKKITKGDLLLKYVDKVIPITKTQIQAGEDIYLFLTGDLIIPNRDVQGL